MEPLGASLKSRISPLRRFLLSPSSKDGSAAAGDNLRSLVGFLRQEEIRWISNRDGRRTANKLLIDFFPILRRSFLLSQRRSREKIKKNAFGEVITEKVIYFYQLSQFISPRFGNVTHLQQQSDTKKCLTTRRNFNRERSEGAWTCGDRCERFQAPATGGMTEKRKKDLSCLRYTLRDKGRRISISLFQSKF